MPRKKKSDLADALAPIFAEMETRVAAAVEGYVADQFAALQSALAQLPIDLPTAPRRRAKGAPVPARHGGRAKAVDVQSAVQTALAAQADAVSISVLREATSYSDSQIRRALKDLAAEGAVEKQGERRDTVYRATGGTAPSRPGRPKRPAKRKAASKRRKSRKKSA